MNSNDDGNSKDQPETLGKIIYIFKTPSGTYFSNTPYSNKVAIYVPHSWRFEADEGYGVLLASVFDDHIITAHQALDAATNHSIPGFRLIENPDIWLPELTKSSDGCFIYNMFAYEDDSAVYQTKDGYYACKSVTNQLFICNDKQFSILYSSAYEASAALYAIGKGPSVCRKPTSSLDIWLPVPTVHDNSLGEYISYVYPDGSEIVKYPDGKCVAAKANRIVLKDDKGVGRVFSSPEEAAKALYEINRESRQGFIRD